MSTMLLVNLPVRDVAVATRFYTGLGFRLRASFSDDECSCLVVSDTLCVMAVRADRFADFLAGPLGDPRAATTAIFCLSADSRDEVDATLVRALLAGGSCWLDPIEAGPMYGCSFADPDGHVWEVLHTEQPEFRGGVANPAREFNRR